MFCCIRTRDRKEGKPDLQPTPANGKAPPPQGHYGHDEKVKVGKSKGGGGLKDGNMTVLAGAGVATAATAAVVIAADSGSGTSQGCCCGGGGGGGCGGGGGGGCGGCGGCGGGGCGG